MVVSDLSAEILLGTTFIDIHVEVIWVRRRACILKNGKLVHLARHAAIDFPKDETNKVDPPAPVDQKVKLSNTMTLPPRSEKIHCDGISQRSLHAGSSS